MAEVLGDLATLGFDADFENAKYQLEKGDDDYGGYLYEGYRDR